MSGVTVAVSVWAGSPILKSNVCADNEMSGSSVLPPVLSITVTWQVAVLPPSSVVTVIVASPGATAVTSPLSLTVAVSSASELHITPLFVAPSGVITAVSCNGVPMVTVCAPAGEIVTLTTFMSSGGVVFSSTVTLQVAVLPSADAVIVVLPFATASTSPLRGSTVATFLLPDVHVTALFVAFDGSTVACSVSFPFTFKVSWFLLSVTSVTGTFTASSETVIVQVF